MAENETPNQDVQSCSCNQQEVKAEETKVEEVKTDSTCSGGTCSTPNDPTTCQGPCPQETTIAAPEGIDIGEKGELVDKLQSLFAPKKQPTNESTLVDLSNYVDVELPNGMTVKVHKNSHKANQADMNQLIEAAGGEVDCGFEDENGNPIVDAPDDGPAKSEYRPGMLRDLKAKYYPDDKIGEQAQARLDSKVEESKPLPVEPEVATLTAYRSLSDWRATVLNSAEQDARYMRPKTLKSEPVELESGIVVYMPKDFNFNLALHPDDKTTVVSDPVAVKAKLEKIMHAATVPAIDRAKLVNNERMAVKRAAILQERHLEEQRRAFEVERDLKEKLLRQSDIVITHIENPNVFRRGIRLFRRVCKRIVQWWRL